MPLYNHDDNRKSKADSFTSIQRRLFFLICVALISAINTGCNWKLNPDNLDVAEVTTAPQQPVPTYKVLVYGKGEPQSIIGKLDAPKTVQDAVDEARVERKFARMEIVLARTNESVHGREKMKVAYDAKKRRVVVSQDYALQENDIVVIKRDSVGSVQRVVDRLSGTLSR